MCHMKPSDVKMNNSYSGPPSSIWTLVDEGGEEVSSCFRLILLNTVSYPLLFFFLWVFFCKWWLMYNTTFLFNSTLLSVQQSLFSLLNHIAAWHVTLAAHDNHKDFFLSSFTQHLQCNAEADKGFNSFSFYCSGIMRVLVA